MTRKLMISIHDNQLQYCELIDYALKKCTVFQLIKLPKICNNNLGYDSLIAKLNKFEIFSYHTNSWPGTVLGYESGIAYVYKFTDESAQVLKKAAHGFEDWQHPERLEDLSLWISLDIDNSNKDAGEDLFLYTTSHEHDTILFINEAELGDLKKEVPSLEYYEIRDYENGEILYHRYFEISKI